MKKILIPFFFLINNSVFAGGTNLNETLKKPFSDTTILPAILNLSLQTYIGKPVDSLFNILPGGYSTRNFMPSRLGYVRGVFQVYGTEEFNHCTIEIFIDTFQFLTIPNYFPAQDWDMNFAKKETIAFIKIIKNIYIN